jgi:hypothetical protein
MQIDFEPKKLKEANAYLNKLNPQRNYIHPSKTPKKEKTSLFKRVVNFFFK